MLGQVKQFWETCRIEFAHVEIQNHLVDYATLTNQWETRFIQKLDLAEKVVLDYGIGGGYLGKYLFDTQPIKSYIGVDIAERSLQKAKEVLNPYQNVTLYHTDEYYLNFNTPIDVFICQAVIQHFFSLEYFSIFLKKIEQLSPGQIMLQIRYDSNTRVNTQYKHELDVVKALYTNATFIQKYLPSYKLEFSSDVYSNGYQYLIFKKM